jgi:RimJ/RimL family protein N-acetyltransferase
METTLYTDRLLIRRFEQNDWRDLYEYLSDAEVVKFEPYDVYSEEGAKEEAVRRVSDHNFYAVCLKDSNKVIGNLYFEKGNFDTWELGYVFNRKYQGKGYATESAAVLMEYAFSKLGARRIIAMCNPKNVLSWKLMERLHMRQEGLLKENVYFKMDSKGEPLWSDTYMYAILKSEWQKVIKIL